MSILFKSFLEVFCLTSGGFGASCKQRQGSFSVPTSLHYFWYLSSPTTFPFQSLLWLSSRFTQVGLNEESAKLKLLVVLSWRWFQTFSLWGLRMQRRRSFSIRPSVPCFLTPEPPAELWWHFTSATCTDSSLIRLRANLSWRDAIMAQNTASDCGVTEEGQLTERLTHFYHLSFSAFPNLFRCGAPVWRRRRMPSFWKLLISFVTRLCTLRLSLSFSYYFTNDTVIFYSCPCNELLDLCHRIQKNYISVRYFSQNQQKMNG